MNKAAMIVESKNRLIRYAVPDDAEAIADLAVRTFRDTYLPDNQAENVESYIARHLGAEAIRGELADDSIRYMVADDGGVLTGYVKLSVTVAPAPVTARRPMELSRLYVDTSLKRSGIGKALVAAAIEYARERGHDALWLLVWQKNESAIRFYRKCGFWAVGTAHFELGSDIQEDFVMVRGTGSLR